MHKNRTVALEQDGTKQLNYPKSNDGWFRSVFVIEGRAFDKYFLPWLLVVMNAVVWTVLIEEGYIDLNNEQSSNNDGISDDETIDGTSSKGGIDFSSYEVFFALVLNSSLAFLLVFRLNRSAERFWNARASWGTIVAHSRSIVSGVLVHSSPTTTSASTTREELSRYHRDEVVRWTAAFSVACMHFIRGMSDIYPNTLLGILSEEQIHDMQKQNHPPLHASDQIRYHLKQLYKVTDQTSISIATSNTQILDTLEKNINGLILHVGALERIRATPLPLVYVSHLRTFLLLFLLSLPYVWENTLGYATIPIVGVTAFALLGLEGAAQEVESPFLKHRTNHLSMDAYCLLLISNITQLVTTNADREIKQQQRQQQQELQQLEEEA